MTNNIPSSTISHKHHIDFLRIAAAFLVIVNHTISYIFYTNDPSPTWFVSMAYFFVSRTAVPLFLMITGALLLDKQDRSSKTAARILRIVVVGLVFSVIHFIYKNHHTLSFALLPEFFMRLWTGYVTNAFWYLYLYAGLLCILPLLQKMAASFSRKQVLYLLVLSLGIGGIYPLFPIFFPYSPSAHFAAPMFSPYLGMLFAGYYIEKYMRLNVKTFLAACAIFLILISFDTAATGFLYYNSPENYLALEERTLLPITGSAICLYIMVKYLFQTIRIPQAALHFIRHIGNQTFGIYLLADIFIQVLAFVYIGCAEHMHILLAMLIWQGSTFCLCGLLAAALRTIPQIKKWI